MEISQSRFLLGRSDDSLDLIRVDNSGQISVLHHVSGQAGEGAG